MADPLAGYDPRAIALARVFMPPLRRATIVGLVAGLAAGAVVMYGLSRAPWPVAAAVAILVTVGIGLAVAIVMIPTRMRRAFEAYSWLGVRESDRFRERTGSPVPGSARDIQAWLADNPPGPITREARVELLLSVGRIEEARTELAALGPGTSDLARLDRAGLRALGETVEHGTFDVPALDAALATIPAGSDLALEGRVMRAVLVTRVRLVNESPDPLEPLLAVRPAVPGATWLVVRRTLGSFTRSLFFYGVAIALFGYVLRGGLYGLFP
jgi:xanthosine utilization system XapX-like protein